MASPRTVIYSSTQTSRLVYHIRSRHKRRKLAMTWKYRSWQKTVKLLFSNAFDNGKMTLLNFPLWNQIAYVKRRNSAAPEEGRNSCYYTERYFLLRAKVKSGKPWGYRTMWNPSTIGCKGRYMEEGGGFTQVMGSFTWNTGFRPNTLSPLVTSMLNISLSFQPLVWQHV